jgi:hypothetical protein
MRYVMMINGDPDGWESAPPDESGAVMEQIYGWFEKLSADGKIADGGAELQHPRTARTARRGADGQIVLTDGPYLEIKEVVGGVVMLNAADVDEAIAIAATWPGLLAPTDSVEVRPVVER